VCYLSLAIKWPIGKLRLKIGIEGRPLYPFAEHSTFRNQTIDMANIDDLGRFSYYRSVMFYMMAPRATSLGEFKSITQWNQSVAKCASVNLTACNFYAGIKSPPFHIAIRIHLISFLSDILVFAIAICFHGANDSI